MPRNPRVDVVDTLYHVMARGVARSDIFYTDHDREDFLRRLVKLHDPEDITLYAFVLMNNHYPFDSANPYGPLIDGGAGRPLPVGMAGSKAMVGSVPIHERT